MGNDINLILFSVVSGRSTSPYGMRVFRFVVPSTSFLRTICRSGSAIQVILVMMVVRFRNRNGRLRPFIVFFLDRTHGDVVYLRGIQIFSLYLASSRMLLGDAIHFDRRIFNLNFRSQAGRGRRRYCRIAMQFKKRVFR